MFSHNLMYQRRFRGIPLFSFPAVLGRLLFFCASPQREEQDHAGRDLADEHAKVLLADADRNNPGARLCLLPSSAAGRPAPLIASTWDGIIKTGGDSMNIEFRILSAVQESEPDVNWEAVSKSCHIEKNELKMLKDSLIASRYITFNCYADPETREIISKYSLTGKGKLRLYELGDTRKGQADDLKLSKVAAYAAIAGCLLSVVSLLISSRDLWLPLLHSLLS